MSDTPRTDAEAFHQLKHGINNRYEIELVHASFARDLERSLATAQSRLAEVERDAQRMREALQELLDAGDNSVNPKDGDDAAAMLRFGKATDAARSALRAGEGEK